MLSRLPSSEEYIEIFVQSLISDLSEFPDCNDFPQLFLQTKQIRNFLENNDAKSVGLFWFISFIQNHNVLEHLIKCEIDIFYGSPLTKKQFQDFLVGIEESERYTNHDQIDNFINLHDPLKLQKLIEFDREWDKLRRNSGLCSVMYPT